MRPSVDAVKLVHRIFIRGQPSGSLLGEPTSIPLALIVPILRATLDEV